jgi:hypothetical protein
MLTRCINTVVSAQTTPQDRRASIEFAESESLLCTIQRPVQTPVRPASDGITVAGAGTLLAIHHHAG